MKSSTKVIIRASADLHEAWNPTEFQAETAPEVKQEKTERILALFTLPDLSIAEKQEKRPNSNVHSIEIGRAYTAWQPGDMNWQPPFAGRESWAFIETSNVERPVSIVEPMMEEAAPAAQLGEDVYDPEQAAGVILTRARSEADEIILEAQSSADNVLLLAQEEIDQQKKEGFQRGLDDGKREFESALKASRVMIGEVREWQKALLTQGEQILVDMVKEISQTMFGEGAKLDANALQVNLNRVMESAQGLGDLNIFLNPRDARLLDPSWSEYQLLISGDKVKIIPSENIIPGGCFVKGSMGTVDGRVETQLAAVLKSFEENKELNG